MADSKELLLEVKLDLKDTKNELKNWVNWMKCFVKIEAIECFPCYLKISFFHDHDQHREYPFSIIRLNIPGVRVGSAASRTKSFTYGVFWKNNRKRCRLFLAFIDKQSSTNHMEWLKKSIDSLEQYRKDILENHRISRSILNETATSTSSSVFDAKHLPDNTKNSLNDTQTERDLNDILGPLPDIPISALPDESRWSIRRASGCSGIYEEIMDPAHRAETEKITRESVVSGIYVDMRTPIQLIGSENAEIPPPLPPRRRHHVYSAIDSQKADGANKRKSSWNLKNVFSRTKAPAEKVNTALPKARSENSKINLLACSKNSFSSPDLTNIVVDKCTQPFTAKCNEIDETDLEIMDIERSNSLNCSANQFLCRPPSLNISANITASHNLSCTLSSKCDPSAINLVGANVNSSQSILAPDLSGGYCTMAPISVASQQKPLERISAKLNTSWAKLDLPVTELAESHYCPMRPILTDLTKNITFDRKFELTDDSLSLLDFSNRTSSIDGNSSSGVSSDEGATTCVSSSTVSDSVSAISENHVTATNDDAISLTYTESPQESEKTRSITENLFSFHQTKFDEKYPSYFPNESITIPCDSNAPSDVTKYTVNNKNIKVLPKHRRKPTSADDYHSFKKPSSEQDKTENDNNKSPHEQHINITPRPSHITFTKPQTPFKVQKSKHRKNSIPENSDNKTELGGDHQSATNENWCGQANIVKCSIAARDRNYKTLPPNLNEKTILTHLDPNTKFESLRISKSGQRSPNQFEKNANATASPRRIYNKFATLSQMKMSPATSEQMAPNVLASKRSYYKPLRKSLTFNAHTTNPIGNGTEFQIPTSTASNSTGSGLMRFASLTRLRKIDFSPLKMKINNILQRSNADL